MDLRVNAIESVGIGDAPPPTLRFNPNPVGWVERSDTHRREFESNLDSGFHRNDGNHSFTRVPTTTENVCLACFLLRS
jgi:hypothetical protein